MKDRAPLRAALGHQNVRAFLAVIDLGEHGPNAESLDRYRTIYGGEKFDAPPWEHPRRKVKAGEWTSSAAGRGQFLAATWDGLLKQYGFPDFSPACQDEAMVALIIGRGALEDVLAGRLEAALAKCSKEWASLPGSPYGQPTITLDDARWRYLARGGQLSGTPGFNPDTLATEHYGEAVTESTIQPIPSADQQEARFMDPLTALSLISTVGPYIVNLIPQVKKLFDPAVPVAERNVGAAVAVLAKSDLRESNTLWAQGGIAAVLERPDSFEAHERDTLEVGCGLSERETVECVVRGGPDAVERLLQRWIDRSQQRSRLLTLK